MVLMLAALLLAVIAYVDANAGKLLEARRVECPKFCQRLAHRHHSGNRPDAILQRRVACPKQCHAMLLADRARAHAPQCAVDQGLVTGPEVVVHMIVLALGGSTRRSGKRRADDEATRNDRPPAD